MKKIIITLLFFLLAICAFSQGTTWSNWRSTSCYSGIQFKVGSKAWPTGGYEYVIVFKSTYPKKVSFSYDWDLPNQKSDRGFRRQSISPGSETSSNGTQTYIDKQASNFSVNIERVCFDPSDYCSINGSGTASCFAECDNNSVPRISNCKSQLQQNSNISSQNPTYQTQQQDNSAKQKSDEEFESKTGSWVEYGQKANASYKAGDYESAVKYAKLQVSASANNEQRENAQFYLDEYIKAKQNAGGANQNSSQQSQAQLRQQQETQRQQEVQQQELKRQQDAQRTAAYVDLGVQTIKSITGLISSLREEERALRDEKRERIKQEYNKRYADNLAKGEEIINKLNVAYSEYNKNIEAKKAEQIGDLFFELGSNPDYSGSKKDENNGKYFHEIHLENANLWYNKSIELGNFTYNMAKKILEYYGKETFKYNPPHTANSITIDTIKQEKFSEVFNHITNLFEKYEGKKNKEEYFGFAKILAGSFHDQLKFKKFDIQTLLEHKKKEKYWLEKAAELSDPNALAVITQYYQRGDFFFNKNDEKYNYYSQKAKDIGQEIRVINIPKTLNISTLTTDEIKIWSDLLVENKYNKIKKFIFQLASKYNFHFVKEMKYGKEYEKDSHTLNFSEFTIHYNKVQSIKFLPHDFGTIKIFGDLKIYFYTDGGYSEYESSKNFVFPYELKFNENSISRHTLSTTSNEIIKVLEIYSNETILKK